MNTPRVNELDLLRCVAVIAVVLFHYAFRGYAADAMSTMPYPLLAPVAKYFYLSLELLFLISGFVIAMTASARSFRHFVISRIVRLYPAFWVCCTITFVVTLAIGEPRYSASLGQYLVNMTMLAEFLGVVSIDGAYWFLYVEIIFYALVATALFIGGMQRFQLFLALWLVAEMALEALPIGRHPSRLLADYSVCFIAGAEFYLIWAGGLSLTRVAMIAGTLGIALLQAMNRIPGFEVNYSTTINAYVVAGVIVACFLAMLLVALKRTGALGRSRWMLAGAVSYPLYLLHHNIGFMIFNALYPAINPHVLFWGTIAGVLGAAFAVHVFIEKRLSLPMKAAIARFAE
jgi:peptidoglycan/LPS O-acetylase OafA/YrhL